MINIQIIASIFALPGPCQGPHFNKALQVSCGGRPRGVGNRYIILGAQPALEAFDTRLKHPGNRPRLPLVQPAVKPVIKPANFLSKNLEVLNLITSIFIK